MPSFGFTTSRSFCKLGRSLPAAESAGAPNQHQVLSQIIADKAQPFGDASWGPSCST